MASLADSSLGPGKGALGVAHPVVSLADGARTIRRASRTSNGRQQSPAQNQSSDGEGCPCMTHPYLLDGLQDGAAG